MSTPAVKRPSAFHPQGSASSFPAAVVQVPVNAGTDNLFYSPDTGKYDVDDKGVGYEFAKYKVRGNFASILHSLTHKLAQPFPPDTHWDPLGEVEVVGDPTEKNLLSSASKAIDLGRLTEAQKDELQAKVSSYLVSIASTVPGAPLVAERGVVFFRDQELDVHQQIDLARH